MGRYKPRYFIDLWHIYLRKQAARVLSPRSRKSFFDQLLNFLLKWNKAGSALQKEIKVGNLIIRIVPWNQPAIINVEHKKKIMSRLECSFLFLITQNEPRLFRTTSPALPAATTVATPVGIPSDRFRSPLSSMNATAPIIRNIIPKTIWKQIAI